VSELGSVFEADDGRARGPELRVTLEVPRAALGATFRAPVPLRLAADGDLVERVVVGDGDPELVELHLPEALPDRAQLRLRGQGGPGPSEDARAGDLLVLVELVDRPPRPGETIVRTAVARRSTDELASTVAGVDVTWWVLLGLALLGAAVLAALYLI
jgi:hypothetical protein